MNARQHREAAESLLREIPHNVEGLERTEDLGALQIIALAALAHATLAGSVRGDITDPGRSAPPVVAL